MSFINIINIINFIHYSLNIIYFIVEYPQNTQSAACACHALFLPIKAELND